MRTCFSMTEPETAGSDPTQLATRAVRDGDYYVINGHKWFTSGAIGARFAIAMVVTDPDDRSRISRASMIIVPTDTPGFQLVRAVSVMGHAGGGGHCEIIYKDCRVPVTNLLGEEGDGFAIAQARLGPGRIHHCMRNDRGGRAGAGTDVQAGEYTLHPRQPARGQGQRAAMDRRFADRDRRDAPDGDACGMEDRHRRQARGAPGNREIKVQAANMVMNVLDRAIQLHGALGMSDDTPIARFWREKRAMRIVDGPDEVHRMTDCAARSAQWQQ